MNKDMSNKNEKYYTKNYYLEIMWNMLKNAEFDGTKVNICFMLLKKI